MPIAVSAAEGYALWAATWDATPSPIVAVEERLLRPRLERLRTRHAIDVGCGTGRWTSRLSALGFDASPEMLAVASSKPGLQGRVAVADAISLPVQSGVADLVLCTLTLGHVRHHAMALREFARILKSGGTLLLTDFHPLSAAMGWRRTFRAGEQVYQLENYPYSLDQLLISGLTLRDVEDGAIGEPERSLFAKAGRLELFDQACRIPAVQLSQWTRL
jgi:malonyl-CoA O-methyltransferase